MTRPKVKICCIKSMGEAELAIKSGASALGLVSEMPSGPGVISESVIAEIAAKIPSAIATFLLTSKRTVNEIVNQHNRCKTTTIQIVDSVAESVYTELRKALPEVHLVQVIHINGTESVQEAIKVSQFVDALLLDSGNQKLEVKELGGTGRTHDWRLSKTLVNEVSVPVYLAGGLNPYNVVEAIEIVQPFGIDICSGVRINGNLDKTLLTEFFKQVNSV